MKRNEAQFSGDDDATTLAAIRLACAAGACRVWAGKTPECNATLLSMAEAYGSEAATLLANLVERDASVLDLRPAPTTNLGGGRRGQS